MLLSFVQKVSKNHNQYQKITETYGDPNNLQSEWYENRTYPDPMELLNYAQRVYYHPDSYYYYNVHGQRVFPDLHPGRI